MSPYSPRREAAPTKFDDDKFYKFLVFEFDTETNYASIKSAEICKLPAIDNSGSLTFSEYLLPTDDIDVLYASAVNKLTIKIISRERKLCQMKKQEPPEYFRDAPYSFMSMSHNFFHARD